MTHFRECEGCGVRPEASAGITLRVYRWECVPEVVLSRVLCDDCAQRIHDAITKELQKHAPRWDKDKPC